MSFSTGAISQRSECFLTAFADIYPIAITAHRAAAAKRRNGTADMLAESHQQGVVKRPVRRRQL